MSELTKGLHDLGRGFDFVIGLSLAALLVFVSAAVCPRVAAAWAAVRH
jgi:hypothetical protein